MENAVKALVIAGGIMLTMLIVSTLLYSMTIYSENLKEREKIKAIEELTKFNLQFTNFARDDLLGYELISLVNKVIDYNQRFSKEGELTGSVAGNYFQYTPVTLEISFKSNGGKNDNLFDQLHSTTRTEINRPAVAKDSHRNEKYSTIKNNTSMAKKTESQNRFELSGSEYLFKKNPKNRLHPK